MDMCSIFAFLYMASIFKTLGMQYGAIDDATLTIIGSLGGLANGFSRITWGILQDKYGFKCLYKIVLITQLLLAPSITLIVSKSSLLYGLWVFIGFCCLGSHFVLFPTVIM